MEWFSSTNRILVITESHEFKIYLKKLSAKSQFWTHFQLNSKNCLVDGHFKLKISDFENILLSDFAVQERRRACTWYFLLFLYLAEREANPASSNGDQDAFLENLLWAAPEVIKDSDFMYMTDIATGLKVLLQLTFSSSFASNIGLLLRVKWLINFSILFC